MLSSMQWWMVRRRVHVSWLIAALSAAIVVGVMLAQSMSGWNQTVWLVVAMAMIGVVLWRRQVYFIPVLVLAGILLGLWRGSVDQSQLAVYGNLFNATMTISGRVGEDPDIGKSNELLLRVDNVQADGHEIAGKLWISAQTNAEVKRGDIVTATGKLQQGFGNFAGAIYRAKIVKVERPEPGDIARQVRDWFADAVRLAVPEPQASLGIGYLVGQRRALPPELSEALVIAGLTHVVVASGYNLTILVRLARRLFVPVSKYLSTLSASVMILAFVAITGASPSMSRAGLVAGLSLAAWYYGRKFHPLVLLPFAAAVTVLINPSYAWNDLGWQLSFAAFAGVMIVAPLMQAYFFGKKKPGTIRQILGETIAAQLVTLPILVLAFGQFSNIAVIANLLVLPFVPLAMLLTFVAGVGALIVPGLASIAGLPAAWLLGYMTTAVEYLAKLPWAQATLQITGWHVLLAYIIIVGASVYMWRVTRYNLRDANLVE